MDVGLYIKKYIIIVHNLLLLTYGSKKNYEKYYYIKIPSNSWKYARELLKITIIIKKKSKK